MKKKIMIFSIGLMILLRLLIYYRYLAGREVYFYSDDAVYAILSRRFYNFDFLHAFHPYWSPGFPIATAILYLFIRSWENAQFLVSVLSATSLIGILYWFFKRYSYFFAFIVAFIAAFAASMQILVVSGGITEPLYIAFLWFAICVSWLAITKQKRKYYIYSGLLFGLAYLTRTEAVAFLAPFILIATLIQIRKSKRIKKSINPILKTIGFTVLVFVAINLPYIVVQSAQIGRFTISGKYAFYGTGPFYALEKDRPTTVVQDVWSTDYPDFHSPYFDPARARKFMIMYFKNGTITQGAIKQFEQSFQTYKSINTKNFFTGYGLYLALFGLFLGLISKRFRTMTLYFSFLWVCGQIWVNTLMSSHYRYLVYALPFFYYLQGLGILYSGKILVKILKSPAGYLIPIFLLADFFIQNVDPKTITTTQPLGGNTDHVRIGEWIKSQGIDVFGGRMEAISFYSGAKLVYMPSETPEEIVNYMKRWGVEYLLARPTETGYAHVAPIADPEYKNPDLELFHRFEDGSLVWKVKLTEKERVDNERVKRSR